MKFAAAALLATVSATCEEGIKMAVYVDKECLTKFENEAAGIEAEHTVTKTELTAMNKDCSPINPKDAAYWESQGFSAKAQKVECSTSAIKSTVYTDAECKGEGDKAKDMSVVWGICTELKMGEGKIYVQVTGAMALQAAAAAALAFVGSQF